jgi:hypothetical protein
LFLSHDDVDHSGNLEQVMDACPNARLVCNWAMIERHTNCLDFPLRPDPAMGVADLDPEFWDLGMSLFALGAVSPWISMVDPKKYGPYVDRVESLDITTIASCHSPVIEGPLTKKVFDHVRRLPEIDAPPMPGHSVLEEIIAVSAVGQV